MNLIPHYDERLCGETTQSTSGNLIRIFSKKKKLYRKDVRITVIFPNSSSIKKFQNEIKLFFEFPEFKFLQYIQKSLSLFLGNQTRFSGVDSSQTLHISIEKLALFLKETSREPVFTID